MAKIKVLINKSMALNFYISEFGMRKPTILCVCQCLCRYLNVFVIALYNYVDFCHICISMSHFSLWFLFIVHTLDFKINEKSAFKEFLLDLSLALSLLQLPLKTHEVFGQWVHFKFKCNIYCFLTSKSFLTLLCSVTLVSKTVL